MYPGIKPKFPGLPEYENVKISSHFDLQKNDWDFDVFWYLKKTYSWVSRKACFCPAKMTVQIYFYPSKPSHFSGFFYNFQAYIFISGTLADFILEKHFKGFDLETYAEKRTTT